MSVDVFTTKERVVTEAESRLIEAALVYAQEREDADIPGVREMHGRRNEPLVRAKDVLRDAAAAVRRERARARAVPA